MNTPFYTIENNDLILDNELDEYVLRIRDMPHEEKPREKMIAYGVDVLTVNELLAVVINVGTKKEGVIALSSRILKEYGSKGIIRERDPKKLSADLNIPLVRACQIAACFELGRRFFKHNPSSKAIIRGPREAYRYFKDMAKLSKEQLRGIYLNTHYCVIHDEVISIGSLNANVIHPREVFKPALEYSAAAIIIAHNHPSGIAEPSKADREVTQRIFNAGKILGVDLIDHIIVTKNTFISLLNIKK